MVEVMPVGKGEQRLLVARNAIRCFVLISCLFACLSCSKREQEEREAGEILSAQLLALQEELKTASAHCQEILTRYTPFEQVGSDIRSCLSTSAQGPFVIQLESTLQTSRIEVDSIEGVEPLLDSSLQKKCIDDVLVAASLSSGLQLELKREADRPKPMWPTYQLEVSRAHQGILKYKELTYCSQLSAPIQTRTRPMTEIREQPFIVGSSVFNDPIYKSLKRCDQHLDQSLQATPTLFSFAIVGRSDQSEDEHVCVSVTSAQLSESERCLCDHLRAYRAKQSIKQLSVEVTAPDGRKLTVPSTSGAVPVKQTVWIARVPTT